MNYQRVIELVTSPAPCFYLGQSENGIEWTSEIKEAKGYTYEDDAIKMWEQLTQRTGLKLRLVHRVYK